MMRDFLLGDFPLQGWVSELGFGLGWISPWLILLAGILAGIAFVSMGVSQEKRGQVIHIFLLAILLRVSLILPFNILSYADMGFRPGFYFANDGYAYSENAWQMLMLRERGVFHEESMLFKSQTDTNPGPFEAWNAALYAVTGKSPLSLLFINALIGTWSAIFVYLFTQKFFGPRPARLALIFSAFWPSLLFWSTLNLRDPAVNIMVFLLVWCLIENRKRLKVPSLLAGLVLAYLLFLLRAPALGLILLFGTVWFLGSTLLWRKMKFLCILLIILVAISVAPLAYLYHVYHVGTQETMLKTFFVEKSSPLEWFNYLRTVRAYGTSSFLEESRLSDIRGLLLFAPLGIVYALFAPFPWQIGSTFFFIGAIEISVLYFCVPFIIQGMRQALHYARRETHLMLFIFIGFSLFMGLIDSNLGTLFRHRAMTLYYALIFLAVGLSHAEKSSQDVQEVPL